MNNTDFFDCPLSQREKLYGTVWLLFETLLFSHILQLLNSLLPTPLPHAEINFLFFIVNFAAVAFILREYLTDQLWLIPETISKIVLTVTVGFLAYFVANFLVSSLLLELDPSFTSVNDDAVSQLVTENFPLMFFGTVILVPIAEECLFRGVVFRGLYDRSPALAWVVSILLFAAVHILGYIGDASPLRLLLCLIQYLPAGVCLAASYRLSGSLLSPILIHAAVNFVGMIALR